jgi:cytochrome c oxidase assembly protein subunit 15
MTGVIGRHGHCRYKRAVHHPLADRHISGATRRRLRIWLAAIAGATFLVLAVGGITRLTHAGLSIVDWQPLVGVVPPIGHSAWVTSFERYQQFPEYRVLRPHMTLAEYQGIFFWEYLHRLLARLIGILFVVPFAVFYFSGLLTRPLTRRLLWLFALGSMQGVVGWLMVKSGLIDRPSVSHYRLALHLVLALAVIASCVWLIRELSPATERVRPAVRAGNGPARALAVVGALLGLQIVWGAFVAGLKAGMMFNTFPLMGGTLLPVSSWTIRPLALNLIQGASGVQWMHRLLGTALLGAALVQRVLMHRAATDVTSRRFSTTLLAVVTAQYVLGILTLVYVVPVPLAVAHQAMAAGILCLWVCLMHQVRRVRAA